GHVQSARQVDHEIDDEIDWGSANVGARIADEPSPAARFVAAREYEHLRRAPDRSQTSAADRSGVCWVTASSIDRCNFTQALAYANAFTGRLGLPGCKSNQGLETGPRGARAPMRIFRIPK